jgi:hypothetical protein
MSIKGFVHASTYIAYDISVCAGGSMGGGGLSGTPKPGMVHSYDLSDLRFGEKADIIISEDDSFYPSADLVWRGDTRGPRVPQIGTMFQTAVTRNQSSLNGTTTVDLVITLVGFHGVTEKTRRTVGGVYNIIFDMTVVDARDGAVIEPTRRIVGNLNSPGGLRAQALIDNGQMEKVRVTDFLTGLLRQELI